MKDEPDTIPGAKLRFEYMGKALHVSIDDSPLVSVAEVVRMSEEALKELNVSKEVHGH